MEYYHLKMPKKKRKRRSRQEIICDVLQACKNFHKPTKIMYQANLSWNLLIKMLEYLMSENFIEKKTNTDTTDKRGRDRYYITSKGEVAHRQLSNVIDTYKLGV